jgi:hypothetical protein
LLDADLSPEDARKTLKSAEDTLKTISRLRSFDKLDQYMTGHLDELISKRLGNPSAT